MDLTSLIIQVISGAIGGNAAGAAKDTGLGTLGNTIAGALGGGAGGQLLSSVLGLGTAAATSGLDLSAIVSGFATGGISGAVLALLAGFVKSKMAA